MKLDLTIFHIRIWFPRSWVMGCFFRTSSKKNFDWKCLNAFATVAEEILLQEKIKLLGKFIKHLPNIHRNWPNKDTNIHLPSISSLCLRDAAQDFYRLDGGHDLDVRTHVFANDKTTVSYLNSRTVKTPHKSEDDSDVSASAARKSLICLPTKEPTAGHCSVSASSSAISTTHTMLLHHNWTCSKGWHS